MKAPNATDHFSANGKEIDMVLSDFWKWAYSDLSNSSNRSVLAKYIVASALEITGAKIRPARPMERLYDLLTRNGVKVDVRAAAYIDSSDADSPDCISFCVSPAGALGGDGKRKQSSDAYVFCIYKGISDSDSPLNLDLWEFFVLPAKKLENKKAGLKTITLPSLMNLHPLACDYYGINDAIKTAMGA